MGEDPPTDPITIDPSTNPSPKGHPSRYDIPEWRLIGTTPGLGHLQGSCFDDKAGGAMTKHATDVTERHLPTVTFRSN